MLKKASVLAVLLVSLNVSASDWYREMITPMTNELPETRGVVVDDLGFVHAQAFNKSWSDGPYSFAHLYTLSPSGDAPWMWGLTQANQMSDCGVFAKSAQRLDCFESADYWGGINTRLEMHSRNGSGTVWNVTLPSGARLLDASLPSENSALLVAKHEDWNMTNLDVLAVNSQGSISTLSTSQFCMPGTSLAVSRFRMPQNATDHILHAKVCKSTYGYGEMTLEEFDPQSGIWSVLSRWNLQVGQDVTHLAMNTQGKAYALIQSTNGPRELVYTAQFAPGVTQWVLEPNRFDSLGNIAAFLVNDRTLLIASSSGTDWSPWPNKVVKYDLQAWGSQPLLTAFGNVFPAFSDIGAQNFALSSQGELIILGKAPQESLGRVWVTNSSSGAIRLAASLATPDPNETVLGQSYLIAGPNNTVNVLRTVKSSNGYTGIRIYQFDLH